MINAGTPEFEVEVHRNPDPQPKFALLDEMLFERGTKEDWEALHELHYKATNATGGHYYRVSLHGELIGVCVMTSPRGLLAPRHKLFPRIKPGKGENRITNTHRYKWLNHNSTLNSRTVVDTMYRGIGIAYRLLNLSSRAEGKRFAEIQSSMSRYNFFAQKAGFKFVKPARSPYYQEGLVWFRMNFEANPVDFVAIMEELDAMSPELRQIMVAEMKEFYYARSSMEKTGKNRDKGTSRVDAMDAGKVLKNLQQLVFAVPLYGVYENPDAGNVLPAELPLSAFDWQPTNAPLKLSKLDEDFT